MPETAINILIILIVLAILALCIGYIIREKKRGSKCIGCPYAKACAKKHCGECSE